jgi:hypothetical protein
LQAQVLIRYSSLIHESHTKLIAILERVQKWKGGEENEVEVEVDGLEPC